LSSQKSLKSCVDPVGFSVIQSFTDLLNSLKSNIDWLPHLGIVLRPYEFA
jgi:hypothetical protein